MSWWTKNRKKVGLAAGLLGGGALMAASGGTAAGLLGGLLPEFLGGTAAAGSGAAASTLPEALAASKGVGQAAMATKGGIDAAIAAEGGSEMGLAGTKAVSDAYFGNAAPAVQKTAGLLGRFGSPMSAGQANTALLGMNMLNQGQAPQQPMPPPPPPAPPPAPSNFAGYGQQPPPGMDPMTWARMSPEDKKRISMMMGAQS